MAVNPKSLKNLNPAKPGEVRNPEGRSSYERSSKEYRMDLAGKTEAEIKRVAGDESEPLLKRKVAQAMLEAKTEDVPILSIIEQFDGKPPQRSEVNMKHEVSVVRVQRGERQFKRQ